MPNRHAKTLTRAAAAILSAGGLALSISSASSCSPASALGPCDADNPDSKTAAHGYICLGKGDHCDGTTLPCCSDECSDNQGRPHNPNETLVCDTRRGNPGATGNCEDSLTPPSACGSMPVASNAQPLQMCDIGAATCAGGSCVTDSVGFAWCVPAGGVPCFYTNGAHGYCPSGTTCSPSPVSVGSGGACCGAASTGGGDDPCGAAGTWTITCPPSPTACGACGTIPGFQLTVTVPAAVAKSGGMAQAQISGNTFSDPFDVGTCTVDFGKNTCMTQELTLKFGGGTATYQSEYECSADCSTCGTPQCTVTKS